MMIRRMQSTDVDAVMDIFNYYIEHTNCNWQREVRPKAYYEKWFDTHEKTYPAFVLEDEGKVVGFACNSIFRDKVDGYDRVVENTLYILPEYQGKGGGKMLMQAIIAQAREANLWTISAWIDSNNQSSIAFHQAFGFYETGMMKRVGNKGGQRLSVSILQLDL
ncbi:MAG: N-acetyltransferase family protein [Eubacteriales bacterium]